jgi:hypothetical protein
VPGAEHAGKHLVRFDRGPASTGRSDTGDRESEAADRPVPGLLEHPADAAVWLVALRALVLGGAQQRAEPRELYVWKQLRVGGRAHRVLAYFPARLGRSYRPPLVVVLHGCAMTAEQEAHASDFAAVADGGLR